MKNQFTKAKKRAALLIICSLFLFLNNAIAQWQQTNGPIGVSVNCMIQHDTVIVCGTLQGIYFTSDSGVTWQEYLQFQNKNIQSMYAKGDTLILLYSSGFTEEYYYDSTFSVTSFDNGVTWSSPLLLSIFGDIPITLNEAAGKIIAIDLFVGPYVSYDYGLSWIPIPLPSGYFADLKITGKNYMLLVMNDVNFNNHYFLSMLDSVSFIPVDTANIAMGKCAVDSVIFGSDTVTPGYIEIIKSVDYGQTWSTIATTSTFQNFGVFAIDSFFCFRNALYYTIYTSDFGVNWDSVPYNVTPYFQQYRSSIDLGNNNFLVTNGGGFSIYNNLIDSASPLTNNIKSSIINTISSDDSVIYCMGNYLFSSKNDCNTWDSLYVPFLFGGPQIIIGDTLLTTNFDVYKSVDGGYTWVTIQMPNMVFYMAKKGNRIYASSGWDTYYSDNFGDSWLTLNSPPQQTLCGFSGGGGGSLCTFGNHLFFADDYNGAIFRLDQNDQAWTYLFCLGFDPWTDYDDPIMLTLNNSVVVSSDLGIFYSNDTGSTWTASACNGLPRSVFGGKIYPTSIVAKGNDWIAACGKEGVLYSYDFGNNWYPFGGPSPFIATDLTISHDQLFVSTRGRGVWTTSIPLSIPNSTEKKNYIEAYPNPTSDYFTIKNLLDIDYPSLLFIYDGHGRLVMQQKVNSDEPINIKSLSPGMYVCRIINRVKETKICRVVVE